MTEKRRPGRRTKEEELREFIEATGGDVSKLDEYLGGDLEPKEIPSAQDIRDRLLASLSEKLSSLQGIALVQALKAITALAEIEEQEQERTEEEDERRPILDRLEALPPDYAMKLIKQEIERVDGYRQDLFIALSKLEA